MNTFYPLSSFFRNEAEVRDFYKKLHDTSKSTIVFLGSGGNGKSQLANQLKLMSPKGLYHVRHGSNKPVDKAPLAVKIIYCVNSMSDMPPGVHYDDVVEFHKTFYQTGV